MTGLQPNPRWLLGVLTFSTLLAVASSARAADLTIWWEEGYYPEEDKAIEAVIADFEEASGKDVELTRYPQQELPGKVASALEAGRPPDLVYSLTINYEQLAYDDALAAVADLIEPVKDTYFPAALQAVLLRNGKTGQRAYYGVPTSMCGEAYWTKPGSNYRTFPRSGSLFGPSGAIQFNPPCAKRLAGMISTALASPCPTRATIPKPTFGCSYMPTRPTT
jgi:ABC-type glycerol-3-phosphate transport system substrate-binding protein